ncbi:MAG: STAS domain-containing protein, partial [Planctomycetes bacterium]|nr:STAS domain-containing protein [Planctomycetota bacterium]
MKIEFSEVGEILVARVDGSYTSPAAYNEVNRILLAELEESPRRTIIDLEGIGAIDASGLGALETLCWRIAKNLGQEIRLANPSPAVQTQAQGADMTVPIHPSVEAARDSFEPEDLDEDLFEAPAEEPPPAKVEVVWKTERRVRPKEPGPAPSAEPPPSAPGPALSPVPPPEPVRAIVPPPEPAPPTELVRAIVPPPEPAPPTEPVRA